jgi:aryl-alcohol dehydrogenase-like predicted oxidoreductase
MAEHHLTRREFVQAGAAAAATLATLAPTFTIHAGNPEKAKTDGIINYNPDMEYRRCGKTGLMISAVCLGGHWKRVNTVVPKIFKGSSWLSADLDSKEFEKNRTDVVSRCIERGINYIDACTMQEVIMYAKALKGRRDKMHLGFSWYQEEMRSLAKQCFAAEKAGRPKPPGYITQKLKEAMDHGLQQTGLEYVDLWRITCFEQSGQHTDAQMAEMIEALAWAKKTGKARFTGMSSHDQPHIKRMIQTYPKELEVICTPYTAKTKVVNDPNGLWAAMKKCDVGWFGIKPFTGTTLFKGDSSPNSPTREEDDRLARLTIRYILCNPAITAPIPGLINEHQVDNVALAVMQRRELDAQEKAELDRAMDRAWANLPYHYQWLKQWEYI